MYQAPYRSERPRTEREIPKSDTSKEEELSNIVKPRRLSDISGNSLRTLTSGSIFLQQKIPRSPLDHVTQSIITQKVMGEDSKIKYSESEVKPEDFSSLESFFTVEKQKGNPGSEILSNFLTERNFRTVTWIIENHFESVARNNFEWIGDLKEAGYGND
jgi:hypothetical protein